MDRNKIVTDIKNTIGTVPGFINSIPDDALESEWNLFKRFELTETALPPKYKELVGIAVASVNHCWYCVNFHKAMAEFHSFLPASCTVNHCIVQPGSIVGNLPFFSCCFSELIIICHCCNVGVTCLAVESAAGD